MRPYPYTYTEKDDAEYDVAWQMMDMLYDPHKHARRWVLQDEVAEAMPEANKNNIEDAAVDFYNEKGSE